MTAVNRPIARLVELFKILCGKSHITCNGRDTMIVQQNKQETIMNYYEEHTADGNNIKAGWIMVLIVNLGLVILSL